MIPPVRIDGALVIRWSLIDKRHQATGNCKHFVAGFLQNPAAGLAICRYQDGEFYLFGCDDCWNCITDTCHATLEEAMNQAEFEYEGITITWNSVENHRKS